MPRRLRLGSTSLDWFHITMRLTVMQQIIKGLPQPVSCGDMQLDISHDLERVKWFLWHGNVTNALQVLEDFDWDVDELYPHQRQTNLPKLLKALQDFSQYIRLNQAFIPNYAERYRHSDIISTAFVESTVNPLISKRFVKKQQMRWTKKGAHLLLQVRTQVINQDWRTTFCRWYPNMKPDPEIQPLAA
jgi:hypothetical protein